MKALACLCLFGLSALLVVACADDPESAAAPEPFEKADPPPVEAEPSDPAIEPVADPVADPSPDPVSDPDLVEDPVVDPEAPPADELTPADGSFGTGTPVDLLPPPPEDPSRMRKRMDIDQLDAAIKRATGGIGWTKSGKNQFEALARTLGKPDYVDLTTEDLEPSALFQKFLDDAARMACTALAAQELTVAPDERVLMVDAGPEDTWKAQPEKVVQNLRYLLLRYHGKALTVASPELEPWRWLYESAEHVTKDPVTAWRTVCIGLITHPGFYTY